MFAAWLMIGFTLTACVFAHFAAPRRAHNGGQAPAAR